VISTFIRGAAVIGLLGASIVVGTTGVAQASAVTAPTVRAQVAATAPAAEQSGVQSRCYQSRSRGSHQMFCHWHNASSGSVTDSWVASTQTYGGGTAAPTAPTLASIEAMIQSLLRSIPG
jgi:hypothetical protein